MSGPPQLVAMLALLLAATLGAGPAVAKETVHVNLLETNDGGMTMTTDVKSVHKGPVTFEVTNKSSGIQHEFLVAPLSVALDKVPYDETKGRVKEAALPGIKELGDLEPGKSGSMTLDLETGKYLLFCNLPGHFKSGMYRVLTVMK
jgi:uncharacterized cupredoxin-like copper-binding protein